eukprot:12504049-Prorocentrum_lima.AAC.1
MHASIFRLRTLHHHPPLPRQACGMNSEWGPGTPLDDDAEMERSGAASETPAKQRRLTAMPEMWSVPTPP